MQKDFKQISKIHIPKIPTHSWFKYISKESLVVNKGGILLKYDIKDKYILLRSPKGPIWRVYINDNTIYVDKDILNEIKKKKKI